MASWPEAVKAVLDHASWDDKFMVAGYSFGGAHALSLCASWGSSISGAFIFSSTVPPKYEAEAEQLGHAAGTFVRLKQFSVAQQLLSAVGETAAARGALWLLLKVLGKDRVFPGMIKHAMAALQNAGLGMVASNLQQSLDRVAVCCQPLWLGLLA